MGGLLEKLGISSAQQFISFLFQAFWCHFRWLQEILCGAEAKTKISCAWNRFYPVQLVPTCETFRGKKASWSTSFWVGNWNTAFPLDNLKYTYMVPTLKHMKIGNYNTQWTNYKQNNYLLVMQAWIHCRELVCVIRHDPILKLNENWKWNWSSF